jgi:hypothetical protein
MKQALLWAARALAVTLATVTGAFPALAAFNDVSLVSGNAIFTVNSIELDVTGSNSVIESAIVGSTALTISVPAGSTFQVDAPNGNVIAVSPAGLLNTLITCAPGLSRVQYTSGTATTIVLTPSTSTCTSPGGGGGGGSSSGSSGGGGGGTTTHPTTPPVVTVTVPTSNPATPPAQAAVTFIRSLGTGAKGADVLQLQKYLNTHGATVSMKGAGSLGHEGTVFGPATRAALAKFQKAHGISPATGFFGPLTRAYLNSHP